MTRLTVFALGIALLAVPLSANLLQNPDFSSWDSPYQPTGWTVEDTSRTEVEQANNPARSPQYSARLTRKVEGTGNNKGLLQQVAVSPDLGYTLDVWAYDDDNDVGAGVSITWRDDGGTYISNSGVFYSDSSIRTWQRLTMVDTAPSNAATADILVRTYGFTGSPSGGRFYVDDASFTQGVGVLEQPGSALRPGSAIAVEPNPTPGPSQIELEVARPGHVRLDVYDMTGSLRANVHSGGLEAGHHVFSWSGRDNVGQLLPSGLYFAVLNDSAGNATVCKLVLRR
jgi:hypothetical protein